MARSFTAASTEYIEIPGFNTTAALYVAQSDLFVWFKSSDSGTTARTIYSESNTASNRLSLSLNSGTAGRVTLTLNVTNTFTIGHSGSYNDGNWHLIRVKRVGTQEHHLYVDDMDTPVVSETSTVIATTTGVNRRRVGLLGAGTSPFEGVVADVFIYSGNLSDADAAELSARTKHPGDISPTSLMSWVSNGTTQVGADSARTPNTFYGSATGTTLVNGPHGATAPTGLTALTDVAHAWVWDYPISMFSVDSGKLLREPGNIIDRGSGQDPRYILYCSEVQDTSYGGEDVSAVMYTSNDLSSWTRYGLVVEIATRSIEDPYVLKDGSDYWLYAEEKTGTDEFCLFHSTDGLTWTFDSILTVTDIPALNTAASPIVWKEGSTYHMIYEAVPDNTTRRATASAPDGTWTDQGECIALSPGTWLDVQAVPDDIAKIGDTYYLSVHGNLSGVIYSGIFSSTDLDTWTQYRMVAEPSGTMMNQQYGGQGIMFFHGVGAPHRVYTVNDTDGSTAVGGALFGDPPIDLIAPADLATDQPTTVTFSWEAYAFAGHYHLYYTPDGGVEVEVADIEGTSHQVSGLDPNTEYAWYVVAHPIDDTHSAIATSETWTFTTGAAATDGHSRTGLTLGLGLGL